MIVAPSIAKVTLKYSELAWHSGITSSPLSSALKPNSSAVANASSALPSWLRIAPLGRPVVPDVYISANRSSGLHVDVGRRRRGQRDQRLVVAPVRVRRAGAEQHVAAGLDRQFGADAVDQRAQFVLHDERARLAVADDVRRLGAGEAEVDRHRHQAGARQRDVDLEPLQRVVGQQRDAIALDEAQAQQRVGQRTGAFVPRDVAQRALRVARADLVRLHARVRGDRFGEGQQVAHGLSVGGPSTCVQRSEAKPGAGMRRRSNAAALRCAKGSLRCSISWPVAKLASLTSFVPLEQSRRVRAGGALTRAAMRSALLGAAYVAAGAHPPPALPAPPWHASSSTTSAAARRVVPGGGDLWGGEKRSSAVGARNARASTSDSRRLFERNDRRERSEFRGARPRCEHRSGVDAQHRPPQ